MNVWWLQNCVSDGGLLLVTDTCFEMGFCNRLTFGGNRDSFEIGVLLPYYWPTSATGVASLVIRAHETLSNPFGPPTGV